MDKAKLHNFIREEIMKECELIEDLQKQIDYLKIVRHEYITNPPELDKNYVRSPRLEVYLDEKIKLLEGKLSKKKKGESKKTYNTEECAYHFVNAYLKFHSDEKNKGKEIGYREIGKYSSCTLHFTSWGNRYDNPIFWGNVEIQRMKKLNGKKKLLEKTEEILGAKLKDYIIEKTEVAIKAKKKKEEEEEEKSLANVENKEVLFSDLSSGSRYYTDRPQGNDTNKLVDDAFNEIEKDLD